MPDNLYFLIREVMVGPEIVQMRQLGGIEIVFHYVNEICNIQGSRVVTTRALGQTLRNREEPQIPRDQVHIAITAAVGSPEGFRRKVLHELFHGFISAPMPRARQLPRGRVMSPRRGLPLHPKDLEDALCYPQDGLARMLHWPSTWNHPYRFGWFEHPVSHNWRNLDNPILQNSRGWRQDSETYSWIHETDYNNEFLEGCANTHSMDSVRNTCRELLRIKRERLYEPGFRVMESPEEDLAESFESYLGFHRLFQYHPMRNELLSLYLHT